MDSRYVTGMLRALKPALKKRNRAERILHRYWWDRVAIVWTLTDVHKAANELDLALTNDEARTALHKLQQRHSPQLGLRWEDLTNHIESHVLGRKLTKREIKQFVQHNKLTIHR